MEPKEELSLVTNQLKEKYSNYRDPHVVKVDQEYLRKLNLPSIILEYYDKFASAKTLSGTVELLPANLLSDEIEELSPGYQIKELGYIVFATTSSGDVYCYDLNRISDRGPKIVFLPHDYDYENMTLNQLQKDYLFHVTDSLYDFLQMFLNNNVPYYDGRYDWEDVGVY